MKGPAYDYIRTLSNKFIMGLYQNENKIYKLIGIGSFTSKNGKNYYNLSFALDNNGTNRQGVFTYVVSCEETQFNLIRQMNNLSLSNILNHDYYVIDQYNSQYRTHSLLDMRPIAK